MWPFDISARKPPAAGVTRAPFCTHNSKKGESLVNVAVALIATFIGSIQARSTSKSKYRVFICLWLADRLRLDIRANIHENSAFQLEKPTWPLSPIDRANAYMIREIYWSITFITCYHHRQTIHAPLSAFCRRYHARTTLILAGHRAVGNSITYLWAPAQARCRTTLEVTSSVRDPCGNSQAR